MGTQGFHGHGHQRIGDALARGQQHVHFAPWWHGVDLGGKVEQLIGGIAHGGTHHDNVVALLLGGHDALRNGADAVCGFEG